MTYKLFYQDAYLKEFEAKIVETGEEDGIPYVILHQTAFYPTGGGQPCDIGEVNGIPVMDVEEVEGQVRHRLENPLQGENRIVQGKVNWERRYDFMQQHAGQHILSAAFFHRFKAETIGFHMGKEINTIDLNISQLNQEMISEVQIYANEVVMENRKIEGRFVSDAELKILNLTKDPSVESNVRIVSIQNLEHNPCGGTHPKKTGEVGVIHILGWEKRKGGVRVTFVCGKKAIQELIDKQVILRSLSQLLSSPEEDLVDQVQRGLERQSDLERRINELNGKIMKSEVEKIWQLRNYFGGFYISTGCFEEHSLSDLQKIAQKIIELDKKNICLLFSLQNDKIQVVFASHPDCPVNMNLLLKEVLPLIDGRGGGKPFLAQGGGAYKMALDDILTQSLHLLKVKLA